MILKLIFLLMPLMSPGLILKTQNMEKGSLWGPKSSHIKSGLYGKTAYTTNLRQGKKFVVCPYLTSSERILQVLISVKKWWVNNLSGKSFREHVRQVFSGTCLPETQGKLLIFSRNWPLEMTLRYRLKVSSAAERQCRNYNHTKISHQKEHRGSKLLERT